MRLAPGDTFDRYAIEAIVGEGGMGTVYRARDTRLARRVALKLLRPERDAEAWPEGAARLLREARAAAVLDHPNVVAIYDIGESGGVAYIVMEYVAGRSLRDAIGDPGISMATRLRWALDIASALAAAHARSLVHRDVKPENVVVRHDGVAKVLDFGIARRTPGLGAIDATRTRDVPDTITRDGYVRGTPRYMAPEQLRGEPVDPRCDQFSWAVLVYELLTGATPWRPELEGYPLIAEILEAKVEPPSARAPAVPAAVEALLMRALAKKPADRFADMGEIVASLEPIAGRPSGTSLPPAKTQPTLLAPHSKPAGAARRAARRRLALGGAVLACLSIASAAVLAERRGWLPGFGAGEQAPTPPPSSSIPSPTASAGPTAVTDLPLPKSTRPQAVADYAEAMQMWRDANDAWVGVMRRAIEEDPLLGAAYLRLVFHGAAPLDVAEGRKTFITAAALRPSLDERDQAILDACDAKYPEYLQRIDALAARYPDDAEIAFEQAAARPTHDPSRFDRAIALDPKFARAYAKAAEAAIDGLRDDEAGAILERCLKASQTAGRCWWLLGVIADDAGRCADMQNDAVRAVQTSGPEYRSDLMLAAALVASGQGRGAAAHALSEGWSAFAVNDASRVRLGDEARLAIATGDFASAEEELRELAGDVGSLTWWPQFRQPGVMLAQIALETGRADAAARVAAAALDRRVPHMSDVDGYPYLSSVLVRAGKMTAAARHAQLETWLADQALAKADEQRWKVWVEALAMPAGTRAEAQAALAERASYPPFWRDNWHVWEAPQFYEGRALLMAGRVDEAIDPLRREARTCGLLDRPLENTWAHLLLGDALEQKGDARGACDEFRIVVDRWGAAKPKSDSAAHARARMAALRCGAGR